MLDKKLVADINRLATLLEEIHINEKQDKYPNLVEQGKKALWEQCEELEKQIAELKK